MVVEVLCHAHKYGLRALGVSFHVGSQQTRPTSYDDAIEVVARIFNRCAARGVNLSLINLGGGFPTEYLKDVPSLRVYGQHIQKSLYGHFNGEPPRVIIEPGRAMVANAGMIQSEIVLVSRKSRNDATRWVYLDIGKFGGMAEAGDTTIRYPILTRRDQDPVGQCVIAGPTCDSADILYQKYDLPLTLAAGDKVLICCTGAYTTTYSSVGFNGFAPLKAFFL
jgi:ornithine decarboxylase